MKMDLVCTYAYDREVVILIKYNVQGILQVQVLDKTC